MALKFSSSHLAIARQSTASFFGSDIFINGKPYRNLLHSQQHVLSVFVNNVQKVSMLCWKAMCASTQLSETFMDFTILTRSRYFSWSKRRIPRHKSLQGSLPEGQIVDIVNDDNRSIVVGGVSLCVSRYICICDRPCRELPLLPQIRAYSQRAIRK